MQSLSYNENITKKLWFSLASLWAWKVLPFLPLMSVVFMAGQNGMWNNRMQVTWIQYSCSINSQASSKIMPSINTWSEFCIHWNPCHDVGHKKLNMENKIKNFSFFSSYRCPLSSHFRLALSIFFHLCWKKKLAMLWTLQKKMLYICFWVKVFLKAFGVLLAGMQRRDKLRQHNMFLARLRQ